MLALGCGLLTLLAPPEDLWIRAGIDVDRPMWALRGGIAVALWPAGIETGGDGGPRGLLRIGYAVGERGEHRLVNFIAVEPDVDDGRWRGLSELEPGADGRAGKLFGAGPPDGSTWDGLYPGRLAATADNLEAEQLQVRIEVEPFANGAHVWLLLTLRSDRPGELMLQSFAHEDSKPIRQCVLTATMGNYARLRIADFADGPVTAAELWPMYDGPDFAPFRIVPVTRFRRLPDDGAIVAMTSDEPDPAANWPYDPAIGWRWPFEPLTQYWRLPADEVTDEVVWAANARHIYWLSRLAIPGGNAFENTELRQDFRPGRAVVFGLSRQPAATNEENPAA